MGVVGTVVRTGRQRRRRRSWSAPTGRDVALEPRQDLSWEPLRIERVCEVAYDHLQGDRFRHATTFVRWRPDRAAEACRYDQLETTAPYELDRIFADG